MKLICLGTGSPEAHSRASSGYLVEAAGTRLLLDVGGGVVDRLIASGRMPADVDALFLTHLHSDHMMDYARLVHARWDEGGGDLSVTGPAPIAEITRRLFGPEGAFAFDLGARTGLPGSQKVWEARGGTLPRPRPAPRVREVAPGFSAEGAGWRLTSCEVPHAQPFLDCMGFRIEAEGKAIVYSGDAGPSGVLDALARGADLLLHWCYRWSWEALPEAISANSPGHLETAAMARRLGIPRLALTHIRRHMDTPEAHARVRAEVAEIYDGELILAEDLMEIEI
ncbi:MAG: MBL fold metallo-hydrolase [Pseudomonadota bacterium]